MSDKQKLDDAAPAATPPGEPAPAGADMGQTPPDLVPATSPEAEAPETVAVEIPRATLEALGQMADPMPGVDAVRALARWVCAFPNEWARIRRQIPGAGETK